MPMPVRSLVEILITEQTCGDACWHAKDDVCHCSCGGKNHGCLRDEHGEQPARTRKLKGAMYQLVTIQTHSDDCYAATATPIYELERSIINKGIDLKLFTYGDVHYAEGYRMEHLPTYIKTASEGEVQRWPELATWRDVIDSWHRPLTLWLRADLLNLIPQ